MGGCYAEREWSEVTSVIFDENIFKEDRWKLWLTMKEIIGALKAYGIDVERKTIYADIEALRQFGLDIIGVREGNTHY